jgi:hypothetical protein
MRKSNHHAVKHFDSALGRRQAAAVSTALLHLLVLLVLVYSAAAQTPGTKEVRPQYRVAHTHAYVGKEFRDPG